MNTKVLVTGANGQLGKTLKDLYFVNNEAIDFVFVTKSELDIAQKSDLEFYFNAHTFDYCINCAAYTNVEQAESLPKDAFKINSEAVGYLAECCKDSNTILIHISTDYVFDGTKKTPYLESDSTNPLNEYGCSKLAGEKCVQDILERFFVIRTSWLYSKYPKNFLTTILSKIKENADLDITTTQRGTPTSCVELSKFIYWLIRTKNKDFGIYHFSAKGNATWYDFALQISENCPEYDGKKISPTTQFSSKAKRPNYSVMDNSKVQSLYEDQNEWTKDVETITKHILKNID